MFAQGDASRAHSLLITHLHVLAAAPPAGNDTTGGLELARLWLCAARASKHADNKEVKECFSRERNLTERPFSRLLMSVCVLLITPCLY